MFRALQWQPNQAAEGKFSCQLIVQLSDMSAFKADTDSKAKRGKLVYLALDRALQNFMAWPSNRR